MISSFGVLPNNQKVIEGIKMPIIASVEPLSDDAKVINDGSVQIPHCTRCRSYLSSVCETTPETWTCRVCSQVMQFKKEIPKEQYSSKNIEVIKNEECEPLMHSIICFAPLKEAVKEYLKLLPKRAPLTIATYTDKLNIQPFGTVELLLSEIDTIPFPETPIPFDKVQSSLIYLLKKSLHPVWHRVFISSPTSDMDCSQLINEFKNLYTIMSRVDVYFLGMNYSPSLQSLVQAAPGISRIFVPINESELPAALFSDAEREFAFQVYAVFRSGVAFTSEYVDSPFLASEVTDNFVKIPVLPSKRAAISFNIIPPTDHLPLESQSFQCVVKFVRWNPKTNRLSYLFRIISEEYKLSNSLSEVLGSINGSLVFSQWIHDIMKLPLAQMSTELIERTKSIASIIIANAQLKPMVTMSFLAKSHPALSAAFWDRLSMGSLLSLASPRSAEALFSYTVEVWDNQDNLVFSGLSVDESQRKNGYIYLIKSFPSIFLLSDNGEYEVAKDSKLQQSISHFMEECMPIPIKLIQSEIETVVDMLSVDEEEGLQGFLESVGIPSL